MPRPGRPGPFLGRPIEIFRVAGIAIALHPSWFFVAVGIAVIIRLEILDHIAGAQGIAASIGVMLVFYSFVLMHELAHALVARHHGLEPKRIVLFLLGGVSQIDKQATRPSHEYQVALAGPLVSLVIAGLLFAVSRTIDEGADGASGVWGWLALLNLLLAAFNLVPGFPLDGGRVLRSGLWAITGDRPRATRIAAACGKLVATALVVGGIVLMFLRVDDVPQYLPLSLAVVGWFLYSMAGSAAASEGAYPPPPEPEPAPAPVVTAPPQPLVPGEPQPVVLPAGDIIPATGRRGATTKRAVPASKRATTSRGLPPPALPRRPARKNDRTASEKTARLEGKAGKIQAKTSTGKARGKSAHESTTAKSNARGRAVRSSNRASSAAASRNQSGNRARHSGTRSADARGTARRGR
jgi:Zn-dependent protease